MRDSASAQDLQTPLLDWYDDHARDLPWRTGPADRARGVRPVPYHVWLSEIMLQQTTVTAVKPYFERFLALWPTIDLLARADDGTVMGEWAGLGYYARARNLLKCARVVTDNHESKFPDTYDGLLGLPGIGPYTAAAIASIAFDRPEPVMDGNVERVMSRLHAVEIPLPASKPTLKSHAADLTPRNRPGDYAQAVMDLGATICTPRNPACGICPWRAPCKARAAGNPVDLPRKSPRKAKPIRVGTIFVAVRDDGAWLIERRPDSGLLGGMMGWPGSDWKEQPTKATPPANADWSDVGEVRHTFTHFHLRLRVMAAHLPPDCAPQRGDFLEKNRFRPSDLPTVMRKAFDLARHVY